MRRSKCNPNTTAASNVSPSMVEVWTAGFIPRRPRYRSNQRWKYHTITSIATAVKVAIVIDQSVVVDKHLCSSKRSNIWIMKSSSFDLDHTFTAALVALRQATVNGPYSERKPSNLPAFILKTKYQDRFRCFKLTNFTNLGEYLYVGWFI